MACSWSPVRLGSTALEVVPLGLAAGYGADSSDVERAAERGVNLFYWGSVRRPAFAEGLRRVAARGRDKVVLVVQTYARWTSGIRGGVEGALKSLKFDHADVLLLGWWNRPPNNAILDAAAEEVRKGRVRAVMISCHHRPTFVELSKDPRVQLLMLRYNAAHPGAERDVFPHLPSSGSGGSGVVSYTATSWGQLMDPKFTPPGERTPRGSDCYRFVLSSPHVDATFMGPRSRAELDEAMRALDLGALGADEVAWMKRVGERVHAGTKGRNMGIRVIDSLVDLVSGFGAR
ncbi:MAG: hypothetical protein WCI05_16660 [Myxococcales bacterium]